MARHARKLSESGVYHVVLRGINRQDIFCDEEDYQRFLEILNQKKAEKSKRQKEHTYSSFIGHCSIVIRKQPALLGQGI